MPGRIWRVKRYQLPNYNHKSLLAEIKSWARQRQLRVHFYSTDRKYLTCEIAPPGLIPLNLVWATQNALYIRYEGSVLYVYVRREAYPELFQDIYESLIEPYVKQYGGVTLDMTPHVLDLDIMLSWLERNMKHNDVHEIFIKALKKEGYAKSSPLLDSQSPSDPKMTSIHLDPEIETVQTTTEEVSVPPGVTIKVKRSCTIEHTVDIDWHLSGGANIDSGFKPIISASIRGEIGQRQGRSYQESETLEYEVGLNGEKSTRYRLTWTDVWRKGTAEFYIGYSTRALPFRFREWAKLEVYPLGA